MKVNPINVEIFAVKLLFGDEIEVMLVYFFEKTSHKFGSSLGNASLLFAE